jgi:rhodanese-related sulfurtransferase
VVHNPGGQEDHVTDRRTVNQLLEACRARIDRFDPVATREAAERGALVIDTRCAEQRHQTGIIPGSVHVPLSVLYWRLDPASGYEDPGLADLDRQIILVCADGYSSSMAAATLRDLGFSRAGDLDGGFSAWQAAGLPVDPV